MLVPHLVFEFSISGGYYHSRVTSSRESNSRVLTHELSGVCKTMVDNLQKVTFLDYFKNFDFTLLHSTGHLCENSTLSHISGKTALTMIDFSEKTELLKDVLS
jgi:hypothetical protein